MGRDRIAVIVVFLICVVLASSLVGLVIYYSRAMAEKDLEIRNLELTTLNQSNSINELNQTIAANNSTIASQNETITKLQDQISLSNNHITSLTSQMESLQQQLVTSNNQINDLNSQIGTMQAQLTSAANQISNLTSTVSTLENEVDELMTIIAAMNTSAQPKTLVFYASEKGPGFPRDRLPDANYTYSQLQNLNNGTYEILLLPEYYGNLNWSDTYNWMSTSFNGIPICLSVFEGGYDKFPNPNVMLTIAQIQQAMSTFDVRMIRIAEMVSWYIEANQTFPADYVKSLLNFARENGLRVLWSEWKVGADVFLQVKNYTSGYEDIVTVAFQTNSGDLEPAEGFDLVSNMFPNWGGSIQSWYWHTHGLGGEMEMPISLFVQHTLEATELGAEALQFEPYRYLFDNGEVTENLRILMTALT